LELQKHRFASSFYFIMLDSLSSKDCFMDWIDVAEGVA
jgi:hypothetical protein